MPKIGREKNKTKLDRFLNEEDAKDDSDFDDSDFDVLCNMARDVLAVSKSTIASISTFSISGHVFDAYRSSLTSNLVQVFICAQNWLHESPRFYDIEEDLIELEKVDLGN